MDTQKIHPMYRCRSFLTGDPTWKEPGGQFTEIWDTHAVPFEGQQQLPKGDMNFVLTAPSFENLMDQVRRVRSTKYPLVLIENGYWHEFMKSFRKFVKKLRDR